MKFSVGRNILFNALQKVQTVVEKKSTVQILSNILCEVSQGKLSLSATDLEVGIKVTLAVEMKEAGKVTLSAKQFQEIVKELPEGPLSVTRKSNDWVEIISGKSRFNIVSLSANEYPALPHFDDKQYSSARVSSLSEMIDKTAFAVSTDATRYHLNGVYFEKLDNDLMRMTATDGHRLSFTDREVFLKNPEFKRGIIIPKKGLGEFKKLLESCQEDQVMLAFDRGYFYARTEDTSLFVRLIEGEYPDYRQVIPKTTDKVARINRDTFTHALRRVSLLAHEKSRGVKFNIDKGQLTISSSNPDMGEAREEFDIDYDGEAVEIGFNAKYLLDCLPVIESDVLEFKFKDRLSPGQINGKNNGNHSYVVMPMRI